MSKSKVRTPLSPDELDAILAIYNAHVREWNIREADLTRAAPKDSDVWSPLVNLYDTPLHPNRSLCFLLKEDPGRRITIVLRKITCYRDDSAFKNEILLENVRTAYAQRRLPRKKLGRERPPSLAEQLVAKSSGTARAEIVQTLGLDGTSNL